MIYLTKYDLLFHSAVNSALASSPHGHLDANDLINRIIIALRPFVEESLRKEIIAHTPKVSQEDIVQIVIKQLENTVITVIKSAVSQSKESDLLSNQDRLGKLSGTYKIITIIKVFLPIIILYFIINLLLILD